MKKAIWGVSLFHVLCFVSILIGQTMKNQIIILTAMWLDLAGAVVCPLVLAIVGGIFGIVNQISVLKLYPAAASCIGGVGLARGVLFFVFSSLQGFAGAMKYLLISFIMMTIWFIIFELTRFLMNKPTKYNKPQKKS